MTSPVKPPLTPISFSAAAKKLRHPMPWNLRRGSIKDQNNDAR